MIVLFISVSLTLLSNCLVESQLLSDYLCSKHEEKDLSIINILVSKCSQNTQTSK